MPYTLSSTPLSKDELTCALIVLRARESMCDGVNRSVECRVDSMLTHTHKVGNCTTKGYGYDCTKMCNNLFSGVLSDKTIKIREPLYKQVKAPILTQCICRNDTAKPNLHWMGDSTCDKYFHWSHVSDVMAYPITVGGKKRTSQPSFLIPGGLGAMVITDVYWQCGTNVWITLPPGWRGCCSLVKLDVSLIIIPATNFSGSHPRSKRSLTVPLSHRRSTKWDKFWRGVIPTYGTIESAHELDRIGYHLESLVKSTMDGFQTLSAEVKAIRTVALQNRAALDYLLAKEGGVCAVVGDTCCTFIPDVSSNMSEVEGRLAKVKQALEDEHKPDSELFAGFTNIFGTFWAKIVHYLIMIGVIFALLFCCCICGIPCLKAMVSKMIGAATDQMYSAHAMALLQQDDENVFCTDSDSD